jgi:hypothetical protein
MGSKKKSVAFRASWDDLCRSEQFRGRWVALDNVVYGPESSQPVEADVVDADDDLSTLCSRMRQSALSACCVLHVEARRAQARRTHGHARAARH